MAQHVAWRDGLFVGLCALVVLRVHAIAWTAQHATAIDREKVDMEAFSDGSDGPWVKFLIDLKMFGTWSPCETAVRQRTFYR